MGPAELLDYDPNLLRGLVLEGGSTTTHVAIVAKALDMPVVGRVISALYNVEAVSYTHLRAHETREDRVITLIL